MDVRFCRWVLAFFLTALVLWSGLTAQASAQGVLTAYKTDVAVIADGNLCDLAWRLSEPLTIDDTNPAPWLPGGTFTVEGPGPQGPEDAALRLYAAWDDEFLYLALDVTDDQLVTDRLVGDLSRQDSVEIVIDPQGTGEQRIPLIFALDTVSGSGPWFSMPGTQVAAAQRVGGRVGQIRRLGYTAELAIPREAFIRAYGRDLALGQVFGLEVRLNDLDIVEDTREGGPRERQRVLRRLAWTGTPPVLGWQAKPAYGELVIEGFRPEHLEVSDSVVGTNVLPQVKP